MVFLSHLFPLTPITSVLPAKPTITTVQFKGHATYDGIHAQNTEIADGTILGVSTQETWDNDTTQYLATFDNSTLNVGNYPVTASAITSYKIHRRKTGELQSKYIGQVLVSSGDTSINDYTAKNNQEYIYSVLPIYASGANGLIDYDTITNNFFGWFLADNDNTLSYRFNWEVNSNTINLNEDFAISENYTQRPTVSRGARKYISGTLEARPYELVNGLPEVSLELLEELRDFISNGEDKYLKNPMGSIWKVQTSKFNYKIDDKIALQPYVISFDFVEVGDGET